MKPLWRRPLDLGLALFFSVSVLYGFLFSLPEGLGVPVAADSPWPPLRALHDWAVAEEPAHLDPPPNLIAACLFDGFFQAVAAYDFGVPVDLVEGVGDDVLLCRVDGAGEG